MSLDNRPHSQRYAEAGHDWADKEAAAQILEDTKSATMAQWQAELGDIPVNRAEQIVKATPKWKEYVKNCVEARRQANLAKVKLEVIRMEWAEWNNSEANARQEMKMTS